MKEKVVQLTKDNKKWIIVTICFIIFVAVLEDVFDNELIKMDTTIFNAIKLTRSDYATSAFKMITAFGNAPVFITITLLILIFIKNKKVGVMVSLNLLAVGVLNQIFKYIVQRPRPIESRLIEESGYSFPSGHSMVSTAFYGLIIYFIFKYVKNKKIRNICCALLSILVLLIGVSRIYLGVHYTSDVIAGFVFSIAYLIIFITIIPKIMNTEKNNQ